MEASTKTGSPDIRKRLKMLRASLDMSQGEMAESLGIKQGGYSDIERGKNNLSSAHMKTMFKKFNVNLNWILLGVGEMYLNERTAA